jgi:hypothetical protein
MSRGSRSARDERGFCDRSRFAGHYLSRVAPLLQGLRRARTKTPDSPVGYGRWISENSLIRNRPSSVRRSPRGSP